VLVHARTLLTGGPDGATDYIDADLRETGKILDGAAATLDFGQSVAVMMMAVLQHIPDADDPYQIVATLLDAVSPGSYLAISHPASDIEAEKMAQMAERLNRMMAEKVSFRDRAGVARFFDGLELVEPGLVRAQLWRPDSELTAASPAALWGGVARKR
jgi:trans-aconitate methyltransferase